MNRPLDTLLQLVLFQVRAQRRNPVWMVSLATAGLLGFSEAFTLGVLNWPTPTQASRAYQLGSVMIFGLMTFLLCAGSLSRDLSQNHRDLLLCRPIPSWVYIAAIYLGNVVFAIGINLVFLAAFLVMPLFLGQSVLYPVGPFVDMLFLAAIPTILFCGALAVLLMCLSRRVIIALPVFLVYFLAVALFRIPLALRTDKPEVDLWDFSMRLYPQGVSTRLGATTLHDMSYTHLLHPTAPELFLRVGLYTGLALVLVGLSVLVLRKLRSH
jgi:hypothetical protein